MSAVRQRGTLPELQLRTCLKRHGLKFKTNVRALPGTPDIVFTVSRDIVLCHGCFWHRHEGCRKSTIPKTNSGFWIDKFEATRTRDARDQSRLRELGWIVLIAWECDISKNVDEVAHSILRVHNTLLSTTTRWLRPDSARQLRRLSFSGQNQS